jgi:TIR domain
VRIQLLGSTTNKGVDDFKHALNKQCTALGVQLDIVSIVSGAVADLTLVFVDGPGSLTSAEQQTLDQLVADSQLILPIIKSAPDAQHLPQGVKKINAFKKDDTPRNWIDPLVDETLSLAWLNRRAKKIFISYRRIDSGPLSIQLFHRFTDLNYEVFLDDASVPRGEDFQRDLLWWLNDADLMLLLGSPRFPQSEWCMKEIAFAQDQSIGVAALHWPGGIYENPPTLLFAGQGYPDPALLKATMEDQALQLVPGDFEGIDPDKVDLDPDLPSRKLTDEALETVVALCARNRAKAIRSRLNEVIPLVKHILAEENATIVSQSFGDIHYRDAANKECFVQVLPFRPLPEHIHAAYKLGGRIFSAVCAYSESDSSDSRAEALRWFASKDFTKSGTNECNCALWAFCGDVRL